jgi:hypothetical protein
LSNDFNETAFRFEYHESRKSKNDSDDFRSDEVSRPAITFETLLVLNSAENPRQFLHDQRPFPEDFLMKTNRILQHHRLLLLQAFAMDECDELRLLFFPVDRAQDLRTFQILLS